MVWFIKNTTFKQYLLMIKIVNIIQDLNISFDTKIRICHLPFLGHGYWAVRYQCERALNFMLNRKTHQNHSSRSYVQNSSHHIDKTLKSTHKQNMHLFASCLATISGQVSSWPESEEKNLDLSASS